MTLPSAASRSSSERRSIDADLPLPAALQAHAIEQHVAQLLGLPIVKGAAIELVDLGFEDRGLRGEFGRHRRAVSSRRRVPARSIFGDYGDEPASDQLVDAVADSRASRGLSLRQSGADSASSPAYSVARADRSCRR